VRNKLAHSRHLVIHAQLISDICGRREPTPIFSYSNLCFWREFPPPINDTTFPRGYPLDSLDQLACRAMILIVNPPSCTLSNSLLAIGDSPDIKTDAISSCKSLIERLYTKSTNSTVAVSFLDAYNILAAAVFYICLVQRAPHLNQQGFAQTFEVVSKASVLLTQCSTKFIAIGVFQQFLLSLSTKIMEGTASVQVRIRASQGSKIKLLLNKWLGISRVYTARNTQPPAVSSTELCFFEPSYQLISICFDLLPYRKDGQLSN
jgi:hypothetical protein